MIRVALVQRIRDITLFIIEFLSERDLADAWAEKLIYVRFFKYFVFGGIVVDAGHDGFDSGAVGPSGIKEDLLNLQVAKSWRCTNSNS